MREIKLTQEKVCLVDDEDYEELSNHKWCYSGGYAMRRVYGAQGASEYIHRRLMPLTPEQKAAKMCVLHLDGNRLNCQKSNLAVCERNLRQQRMVVRAESGFKGVTPRGTKFTAHIGYNGKTLHLGSFEQSIDAARAYNQAAVQYYGPHAQLNKIAEASS